MRFRAIASVGRRGRKSRFFEAFSTANPQGSGTGLGLEILHRIVTQKFNAMIEMECEPGNTRFIVRLPWRGRRKRKPGKARLSECFPN